LKASHRQMTGKKAAGVDRVTKKDYAYKCQVKHVHF